MTERKSLLNSLNGIKRREFLKLAVAAEAGA